MRFDSGQAWTAMDTDGAVGRAGEVTGCCCGAEAGSEHLQTGRVCCRVFVRVCAGWSPWMRMCVCVCVRVSLPTRRCWHRLCLVVESSGSGATRRRRSMGAWRWGAGRGCGGLLGMKASSDSNVRGHGCAHGVALRASANSMVDARAAAALHTMHAQHA